MAMKDRRYRARKIRRGQPYRRSGTFAASLGIVVVFVAIAVVTVIDWHQFGAHAQNVSDNSPAPTVAATMTPVPSVAPTPTATPVPTATPDTQFVSTVAQSAAVSDSYFDDALFIGDSRTEDFMLYSGLPNATSYAKASLSVSTAFTKDVITAPSGGKKTVVEALNFKQFKKVYIMFGINELGWNYPNLFIEKYAELIDAVKKAQPNAIIYIQAIIPVSAERSAKDVIYNNTRIAQYNNLIYEMAQEKQVYFIDPGSAMVDETGALPADASSDGIHPSKAYCEIWVEYLKTHTVS